MPPSVVLGSAPAQAPTGAANQAAAWPVFDDVITAFIGRRNLAGVSLAVAHDGELVYAQTYGTRDTATGAPVDYSSRFNLASLTKVITATTVMRLAEQGRIDLEARVVDVLAGDLVLPDGYDRRFDEVTVRQLLSHTSGLNPKPPLGPIGAASCAELVSAHAGQAADPRSRQLPLRQRQLLPARRGARDARRGHVVRRGAARSRSNRSASPTSRSGIRA